MNSIDVLLIIILCVGTVIGFFHGLLRTVVHIVILYAVTVVAAFAYPIVGNWLRYVFPGTSDQLRNADAFLFLVLLLFNIFALYFRQIFKTRERRAATHAQGPGMRGFLDKLGGMVFGFFLTAVWIGIALLVARFLLSVSWLQVDEVRFSLLRGLHSSSLAALFERLLPYAVATLKPWFAPFGGLPDLFILQ